MVRKNFKFGPHLSSIKLRRSFPPGAYDGPNRHEEMQRANDLVAELNACDVENPMTQSALQQLGHARHPWVACSGKVMRSPYMWSPEKFVALVR